MSEEVRKVTEATKTLLQLTNDAIAKGQLRQEINEYLHKFAGALEQVTGIQVRKLP